MHLPGSITKVVVKDFVTYSYVEIYPGPSLNMLIAPNGSGKSTIMAAIILGLGGSPKTIGRSIKISEFIRYGCEEATCEIFLQGHKKNEIIKIKRKFNANDKSTWWMNDFQKSFNEIEKLIKKFNIQIDNLCQFLPQDRVQEFSRMNKKQLLEETQLALCRKDLIDKQLDVIKIQKTYKDLTENSENNINKLQELKNANSRIGPKILNLRKRDNYLKDVEDIDRKVAWLKYEKIRDVLDQLEDDKKKAALIVKKQEESLKPIENSLKNIKKEKCMVENIVQQKGKSNKQSEDIVKNEINKNVQIRKNFFSISQKYKSRIQEINAKKNNLAQIKDELNALKQSNEQLVKEYGDENGRQERTTQLNNQLKNTQDNLNNVDKKMHEMQCMKKSLTARINNLQYELNSLSNAKQQCLESLRQKNRNVYEAVQLFRNNKHVFKGEIYEPIMLELNVFKPEHAIYIKNTISFRDKYAFVCVLVEDMNKLLKLLNQHNLRVNVLSSTKERPPFHSYQPPIPIEELKQYGMFAYLHTLFTGPEPVMKLLCKSYRIHAIPIGNDLTNDCSQQIPKAIRTFYSDFYRYSISFSKYNNSKSVLSSSLQNDNSFIRSVSEERIEDIKADIVNIEREYQMHEKKINDSNVQITQLIESKTSIENNRQQLFVGITKIKNNKKLMDSTLAKLKDIESDNSNVEDTKRDYDRELKDIGNKMIQYSQDLKHALKKYSLLLMNLEVCKLNLNTIRKQEIFLENKLEDDKNSHQQAEQVLARIKDRYYACKTEAKGALANAKQLSNGFTPMHEGFRQFQAVYNELPKDNVELQKRKENVLTKIDCLNTADLNELREYESREELITKLTNQIDSSKNKINTISVNLNKYLEEWLMPLQELICKINENFSSTFSSMGCAGEVSLYSGNGNLDYSEYGLCIKVRYRNSASLQELNVGNQSGGERTVATSAYMLALQELTPVPFRCVDEINQGMDENTEKQIFEILTDATNKSNTSQYFYISPKLVPKLKYSDNTKIHIILNGPFVHQRSNWSHKIEKMVKE